MIKKREYSEQSQSINGEPSFNLQVIKKVLSEQASLSLFDQLKKVFKIKFNPDDKVFDLRESFVINNKKAVKNDLSSECYKVTFIKDCGVFSNPQMATHDLYLTYDELISEEDKQELLEKVGVQIDGDGAIFQIESLCNDVKMIFDKEDSLFIETEYLNNGEIIIKI